MRRSPLGEVIEVRTAKVVVRLREFARSAVVAHSEGISSIGQPGELIGIDSGHVLLVARIDSIIMKDDFQFKNSRSTLSRHLEALVIGRLIKFENEIQFSSDRTYLPALGAQAIGLSNKELECVLSPTLEKDSNSAILLGNSVSPSPVPVNVNIDALLTRHFAVLGSSGQGKTHFVASILQKLISKGPNARIVIFDIHDEYGTAFAGLPNVRLKQTVLGANTNGDPRVHLKIPYYALGRTGISRLILPSEKTQRPALNFAIDNLKYVIGDHLGAKLYGDANNRLFDDCRPDGAGQANAAITTLKGNNKMPVQNWPHMKALACLAAEWAALERRNNNFQRSAFQFGNVSWMLHRINRLIEDVRFNQIISTGPSLALPLPGQLSMLAESKKLVDNLFGGDGNENWNVHIVTLKQLPNDLSPHILGSILELFAEQLFLQGPGNTHPTLLVLEEAHHYLRQIPGDAETGMHALAYERLAREGRKFQVSMLVSTQRPSEVSPTVLAQCGSWAVFRLTNEKDQSVVSSGAEKVSQYSIAQIPGLARGQAILFGDALPLATKLSVCRPEGGFHPSSDDASFSNSWQ